MTRSVEIPEEAVEKGAEAYWEAERYTDEFSWAELVERDPGDADVYRKASRTILSGALPYLAPAEPENGLCPAVWYPAYGARQWCTQEKDHTGAHVDRDGHWGAPAGDGGLREALAMKVGAWKHDRGDLYWASQELGDLLATHPAAPDVPQPVDREALRGRIREAIAAYLPSQWVEYDEEGGSIAAVAADVVLAVLAGEQEQVEK